MGVERTGRMQAGLAALPFRLRLGERALWIWRPTLVVVDGAHHRRAPWEGFDPADLPPEAAGVLCRRLPSGQLPLGISRQGRWCCCVRGMEKLYFVGVEGTWEDSLGRFSAKRRHHLKRSLRWSAERCHGRPVTLAGSGRDRGISKTSCCDFTAHIPGQAPGWRDARRARVPGIDAGNSGTRDGPRISALVRGGAGGIRVVYRTR